MTWRPWQQAWHEGLYGTQGFYRRPEGPAGHFATSAQGVPGVGAVLAQAVRSLVAAHDLHHVVDIGAGRGELLRELHRLDPDLPSTGVDIVPRPDDLPDGARWAVAGGGADLADGRWNGALVIAHEWLDVVPTTVAELDDSGTLRQVEVDHTGTERLGRALPADDAAWCRRHWLPTGPGERVEIGRARDTAWDALCQKATGSLVVAVDYGHDTTSRPPYGTLTGFREGGEVRPVPDGSCDLTAHVAVDTLHADRRVRQADLLRELDLVPPPPEVVLAHTEPPRYLAQLAERHAALHAVSRPGPGDFWWVLRAT